LDQQLNWQWQILQQLRRRAYAGQRSGAKSHRENMVHTAMEEVVEATCSMISTTAFGRIERDLCQECVSVFVIIICHQTRVLLGVGPLSHFWVVHG